MDRGQLRTRHSSRNAAVRHRTTSECDFVTANPHLRAFKSTDQLASIGNDENKKTDSSGLFGDAVRRLAHGVRSLFVDSNQQNGKHDGKDKRDVGHSEIADSYASLDPEFLPLVDDTENDHLIDGLAYIFTRQERQYPQDVDGVVPVKKWHQCSDFLFSVYSFKQRPMETFFAASHMFQHVLQALGERGVTEELSEADDFSCLIIAAMDVASKGECCYGIAHHFGRDYNLKSIRKWERQILRTVDFDIGKRNVLHFIRIYEPACKETCETEGANELTYDRMGFWTLCKGLAVCAMYSPKLINRPPSKVAAAVMVTGVHLYLRDQPSESLLSRLPHRIEEYAELGLILLDTVQLMSLKKFDAYTKLTAVLKPVVTSRQVVELFFKANLSVS